MNQRSIEEVIRSAGSKGIQPVDIASALGTQPQLVSRPIRRLMMAGKIARYQKSHRRVYYFAPEFAPEYAEVMQPVTKEKPAKDPGRLVESHARCVEALRKVGKGSATAIQVAEMIAMNGNNTAQRLNDLERAGLVEWRRDSENGKGHLRKRWYLSEHAPEVIHTPTPQRLTSIREANRGLDLNQPTIYPEGFEVTKCPSFVANMRYMPDPSIAGRGVISRDWMDRRA